MTWRARMEYLTAIYDRYHRAPKALKGRILDELCRVCGYHRKYAISQLHGPRPAPDGSPGPAIPGPPRIGRPS